MSMITFDRGDERFVYRAAAVIIENEKVLLGQAGRHTDFWFVPGGRVEMLETSEESLKREMREELNEQVEIERLLWIEERFFTFEGFKHHAIVMYYLTHLPPASPLRDQEAVYRFQDGGTPCLCKWHGLESLYEITCYPPFIREAIHRLPDSPRHIISRDEWGE